MGTLYIFELRKIFQQKIVLFAILAGSISIIFLNVSGLFGEGYYYVYQAADHSVERETMPMAQLEIMRRDYLVQFSGQVLDESLMDMLKENYGDSETGTIQWNLNEYSPFLYLNVHEDRENASAQAFYKQRLTGFSKDSGSEDLSETELEYWQDKAGKLGPIVLDYAGGWQTAGNNFGFLSLVTIFIVTVGLCREFSREYTYRTNAVIKTSVQGRKTVFYARILAGISFCVGIALVLFGIHIVSCGVIYGWSGFFTPLQLWSEGSSSALNLSIGGFILILLALLILGAGMTGTFVMFLSESTRSPILAMLLPFVFSALVFLEVFHGKGRIVEQIARYIPVWRASKNTLEDDWLVILGSVKLNGIQASFIFYTGILLGFVRVCRGFYGRNP